MLRALAGFPGVIPVVHGDSRIQTVSVYAVADAVILALEQPKRTSGQVFDLVERQSQSLADIVEAVRSWLGFRPASILPVPAAVGRLVGLAADAAGWLGWRSPLRSTALQTLRDGVAGDASTWRNVTGQNLGTLEQTLSQMPATAQERWFSRIWLLKPAIILCLAAFWFASGLIGLAQRDAAAAILTSRGFGVSTASFAVIAGSIADLVVGAAVLVRRWAKTALVGMIAITLCYLGAATLFTPDLWLDPLGPMVKSVPALLLCLVALAVLEER